MQMKDSTAEVAFKEALRLKLDYAEAHYNLALALLQTGRKEESNTEFQKAYQLAPHLRATGKPNSSQTPPKN
jgi:Flp pilus assembly protein TadD